MNFNSRQFNFAQGKYALRSILMLTLVTCLVACDGDKKPPKDAKTINGKLKELMMIDEKTQVKIAPQTKQKAEKYEAKPEGKFQPLKDGQGLFSEMIKASGIIKPCDTKPSDLKDKKGFLELIGNSESFVLNPGPAGNPKIQSERATFGWFVQRIKDGKPLEYFILFSYDRVTTVTDDDKQNVNCAFEVFVFGGFTRKGTTIKPNPPKLIAGLAVNAKGDLLQEVPPDIAQVRNSQGLCLREEAKGDDAKGNVKPGVETAGKGCLACHDGGADPAKNSGAQSTIPFPWYKY